MLSEFLCAAVEREMEKEEKLSWPMQLQRVYALQQIGDVDRALLEANQLSTTHPESTELALVRADLLIRAHQRQAGDRRDRERRDLLRRGAKPFGALSVWNARLRLALNQPSTRCVSSMTSGPIPSPGVSRIL